MRFFLLLLISSFLFTGCDDGDVITEELSEFGNTFEACGEIVFFKTKEDPAESLSLILNNLEIEDLIETTVTDNIASLVESEQTFLITSTNTFNYRTYNTNPENFFCNDLPPSNIEINSDQESTTGEAIFTMTLVEDDDDGIPAEDEDINDNGDLTDDDTDGDGIPNYLDADDDGDNVLTIEEDDNADGDNNPFTNPLNTDGIDEVNYLDTDDDNDGVLTRDEESELDDMNPANDTTDAGEPTLPDYLNDDIAITVTETGFRDNDITQQFTVNLFINNIQFPTLIQEELEFGFLDDASLNSITRTVTPDFN